MTSTDNHVFNGIIGNVHQGARLLDSAAPGWANKVDLDLFDMRFTNMCVLGKVYGGYFTGLNMLGLDHTAYEAGIYGFSLFGDIRANSVQWTWLNDAWRTEIVKRQRPAENPAKPQPRLPRARRPRYIQSAEVSVTYAPGQNVSVTKRGNVITKVTTWTTGVPNSTKRH